MFFNKILHFVLILLIFTRTSYAINKNNYSFDLPYLNNYSLTQNNINYKLLKTNTLVMVGGSVVGAGILYLLPESFTNWDKDDSRNIFKKWKDNVSKGPVTDKDDFFLNYITHPYWGAVYYMSARSSGANALNSFFYSILLSTFFWEYGVEAFAEIPSKQDLIITPVVGSIFGELFYRSKRNILNNNYELFNSTTLGKTAIFLMDPITEISKFLLKNRNKKNMANDDNLFIYAMPVISDHNIGYNFNIKMKF